MDIEFVELQFCGKVQSVAEDEFGICISEDEDMQMARKFYAEYVAAGKPKSVNKWIKDKLQNTLLSVGDPPHWLEDEGTWPFHDGKPMVFLGQFTTPLSVVAKEHASPGAELYVFGARSVVEADKHSWTMVYRVVQQHPDFASPK